MVLLAVAVVALPAVALGASPEAGSGGAAILIEDFAFTPADVEVAVGQTVTWTVGADPEQHTVTPADGAAFEDSGQLFTGDTYAVRFDAPGAFDFLCTLHPFMTGTVTVVAAEASPSAGVVPSGSAVASAAVPSTVAVAATATPAVVEPGDAGASGAPVGPLVVIALLLGLAAVGAIAAWRRRGA